MNIAGVCWIIAWIGLCVHSCHPVNTIIWCVPVLWSVTCTEPVIMPHVQGSGSGIIHRLFSDTLGATVPVIMPHVQGNGSGIIHRVLPDTLGATVPFIMQHVQGSGSGIIH